MRTRLLALAAVAALAAAAPAADPPVVFQAQPVGKLLDDVRGVAQLLGGAKGAEEFNKGLRDAVGDKGFDGLDLTRPVAGYVVVPADPAGAVAVLALPVTGEEDFVALLARMNRGKPPAAKDGVYVLAPRAEGTDILMRVADGYAYVAVGDKGANVGAVLAADKLVPFAKLYDPADPSLASAKVYFDRFPKELQDRAAAALAEATKGLAAMPLPPVLNEAARQAVEQFGKLGARAIDLSKGAKAAGLKLNLDAATGDFAAELTLTAEPGSQLAKDIAGRKPTTNAFAGLVTADAVVGGRVRLPLFAEEVRAAAVGGLEELRKVANNAPPQPRAFIDELLQGAVRTAKAGEADAAGVVRGPDKDGFFTAVGAVGFDDPSKVEAEFRKLMEGSAPAEAQDLFKWDAEKVGGVSVHTFALGKMPQQGKTGEEKAFGDDEAVIAFAFAPKAVVVGFGPGEAAAKAVKEALAAKPGPAPVLDVVFNPAKAAKLLELMEPGSGERFGLAAGTADKPVRAARVEVAGGAALKVTVGFNLRLLPRGGATFEPADPPAAEKK